MITAKELFDKMLEEVVGQIVRNYHLNVIERRPELKEY